MNIDKNYAAAPIAAHKKRSVFKLNHSVKFDGMAGKLIPFEAMEVLPGDTFSSDLNAVVRMSTPLFPVMDDCFLDVYAFFVPNRIIFNHWEELMGENKSGYWTQSTTYLIPMIKGYCKVGSALDYLGYGASAAPSTVGSDLLYCCGNVLPLNAYIQIWNDWFRDENTQAPQTVYSGPRQGSSVYSGYSIGASNAQVNADVTSTSSCYLFGGLLPVNKYHDYFTSCLPQPQKGSPVSLPLGSTAPIVLDGRSALTNINFYSSSGSFTAGTGSNVSQAFVPGTSGKTTQLYQPSTGTVANVLEYSSSDISNNYVADLSAATSATVNDLIQAFNTQTFLVNQGLYGSRYIEVIKGHFNVDAGDYRLARSEYLGSMRININTNQVAQTSSTTDTSPLGELAGFTYGSNKGSMFTKSFTEHGWLIYVAALRTRHTYSQGFRRDFMKNGIYDFYFPEFANLPNQPVYKDQLFGASSSANPLSGDVSGVFGYQEAWNEYRIFNNRVSGRFRPDVTESLASWTYTDDFSAPPTLNSSFMVQSTSEVARTLATTDISSQFLADFYISGSVAREMPMYSEPARIGGY